MTRFLFSLSLCILCITLFGLAQDAPKKTSGSGMPDKALMQKIWDGWATLDPANTAQFYAKGQHTFFDIAPLKYDSWDEYQQNVKNVLAGYKAATFTVNDDAQIHSAGQTVWGTATVKSDMTEKSGKRDLGAFRWTVVWQKDSGQWLIVHEHVSAPLQ
ncbi:MAG TPA: nuclear transport factor 2 family protein [Terriglobales bacterium]|nr:nuclear transport factor 2 family protein [Terriglobales bacterium]